MDNENRIPLKFLDKAEDCCDRIESTVLGLANQLPDPQELDRALRAAHSVKGGAAMMGFIPLSRVAHQLEDFFKILRVRYHSKAINTEVETLLLQGVDCLRQVSDLHRQGATIDDNWFATRSQPIFDRLRQHLGELRPEDEDALLSQEGDLARQLADKAIKAWRKSHSLVLLGRFEGIPDRLPQLQAPAQLELDRYNPAISDLEGITDLQPIDLTALQFELAHLDLHAQSEQMPNWDEIERAQLPSELVSELEFDLPLPSISRSNWDDCESSSNNFLEGRVPPDVLSELAALEVTESFSVPNWDDFDRDSSIDNLPSLELLSELAAFEIDGLPSDLERDRPPLELLSELAAFEIDELPSDLERDLQPDLDYLQQDRLRLELLSELAAAEVPDWDDTDRSDISGFFIDNPPPFELLSELANIGTKELPAPTATVGGASPAENRSPIPAFTPPQNSVAPTSQTVRVPVEYLQQLNTVFGQLILERNAIDLRLDEIHNYTGLLRKRMKYLESSNQELRQ